jgi:hypothetical protein
MKSQTITLAKFFLLLLLDDYTPRLQKRLLFLNISNVQLSAIIEISINVLADNLPLDTKVLKALKNRSRNRVLKYLASKTKSSEEKVVFLRKKWSTILIIIKLIKNVIVKLLK